MPHYLLLFLVFIPVFALADRWCGGGLGWEKLAHDHGGPLRGRPGYYLAIPLVLLGYLAAGVLGAALALAWLVYRGSFGFPHDTLNGKRIFMTLARHAIMIGLAAVPLLIMNGNNPEVLFVRTALSLPIVHILFPMAVYAVAATSLAVEAGRAANYGRDINGTVEACRGACFGFAYAAMIQIHKVAL